MFEVYDTVAILGIWNQNIDSYLGSCTVTIICVGSCYTALYRDDGQPAHEMLLVAGGRFASWLEVRGVRRTWAISLPDRRCAPCFFSSLRCGLSLGLRRITSPGLSFLLFMPCGCFVLIQTILRNVCACALPLFFKASGCAWCNRGPSCHYSPGQTPAGGSHPSSCALLLPHLEEVRTYQCTAGRRHRYTKRLGTATPLQETTLLSMGSFKRRVVSSRIMIKTVLEILIYKPLSLYIYMWTYDTCIPSSTAPHFSSPVTVEKPGAQLIVGWGCALLEYARRLRQDLGIKEASRGPRVKRFDVVPRWVVDYDPQ